MGIPTKVRDLEHSALWSRAYNLIVRSASSLGSDQVMIAVASELSPTFTSCVPSTVLSDVGVEIPAPSNSGLNGAIGTIGAEVPRGSRTDSFTMG